MKNKENIKSKTKKAQSGSTILACLVLILITLLIAFTTALPTGPDSIVVSSNTTGVSTSAKMVNISGGYIAKMNMTVTSQNTRWKAFLGEIDGKFTLDDAAGSTIYDWSTTTTNGQVYATRGTSSVQWNTIGCASSGQINTEDSLLGHTGTDNISSTFNESFTGAFMVGSIPITAASGCSRTNTYVDNVTQSIDFEEVILYDTTNSYAIFTTILEQNQKGYDGNNYDFQMIVPENATAGSAQTPYYIYLELTS